MRVRRLEVENFRGIRRLDWKHIGDTAALVGPGDTGKSTVLDALERVLSPRWNLPFDDSDFYALETAHPIHIRATIVDFPPAFLKESQFGLALHAFDEKTGKAIPPTGAEDEVYALVLDLAVDSSLEPQWRVIDAKGGEIAMHVRDREALGMIRVGGNIDVHLGWNRGSVLSRLTETGDEVAAVIAEATRRARAGLDVGTLDRLTEAAQQVEQLGKDIGAAVQKGLAPHLDVASLAFTGGSLSLHDGEVPLRRAGLGTRRLMAIAMQHGAAGNDGLTLLDEVEHGLEPHRIRQLLRRLRGIPPESSKRKTGQLVVTTHSPTVLSELDPHETVIVRRNTDGELVAERLPGALSRVVSKTPLALLARRVVVAEGPTEVGLLQTVEEAWGDEGASFAYFGTIVVDGNGDNAPDTAGALRDLGYTVALFVDLDTAKPRLSRAKGARVLAWGKGTATENVLARDLSDEGFASMIDLAARSPKVKSPAFRSMRDSLANAGGRRPAEIGDDPAAWAANIPDFRKVFGAVAKKNSWFKTLALGRELGRIVAADWDHLAGKETRLLLESLHDFAQRG